MILVQNGSTSLKKKFAKESIHFPFSIEHSPSSSTLHYKTCTIKWPNESYVYGNIHQRQSTTRNIFHVTDTVRKALNALPVLLSRICFSNSIFENNQTDYMDLCHYLPLLDDELLVWNMDWQRFLSNDPCKLVAFLQSYFRRLQDLCT